MSLSTGQLKVHIMSPTRPECSLPPSLGSAPWLILSHGRHRQNQSFFDLSTRSCYIRSVPEMSGKHCYGCSHGWLLMLDKTCKDCYLWSPSLMERISLPPMEYHPSLKHCALSSSPTDPDCAILFWGGGYLLFCHVNDSKWTRKDFESEELTVGDDIVGSGKKLYTLNFRLQLLEVNVTATCIDVALVEEVEELECLPNTSYFHCRLVESCGDIFAVLLYCSFYTQLIANVDIFQRNASDMVWERTETLGSRALLLSLEDGNATWCFADDAGVESNCVYFTLSYPDADMLYVFRLDDHSISLVDLNWPKLVKSKNPCQWVVSG